VAFLGGDPDKPVIVGQLYNQQGLPPALSTMDGLPGNKHLSGIKSREIKGGRSNQLRLDDTTGQISAQLASDHGRSELNLGYLTQPKQRGYAKPRGEGAELRSDQRVAIRGAEGVLVTAEASGAENQQLARDEFLDAMTQVKKLAEQLSAMAEKHAKDAAQGPQLAGLVSKLERLNETASQIVALRGADGILVSSGQSFLADAAKDIDIVSGVDTKISAAGMAAIRSAAGLSFFSNERGIKLTAAAGQLQLQAQSDGIELVAKRVLDIISATGWINLTAKQGIRISAGGSEFVLDAQGLRGRTGGAFEVHASEHRLSGAAEGGGSVDHEFPELSRLLTEKSWVEIALVDGQTPLRGQRYILTDPDGQQHQGVLNDQGCARVDGVSTGHCKVEFPDIGKAVEVTT
jgi:type VI secretion system secreted protein VgrG